MILVFIGAPGSGKGTIAALFEKNGWVSFSMGQALRDHVKQNGKYAREVDDLLKHGRLARDEVAYEVLRGSLKKLMGKNIIFDGFPRNVKQTIGARKVLRKLKNDIDAFILFDVSKKEILSRLKKRKQCEKCGKIYGKHLIPKRKGFCDIDNGKLIQRNDDKPSVIGNRFRVYYSETFPVIEEASKFYPVFRIDALGTPPVIFKRVQRVLSILK